MCVCYLSFIILGADLVSFLFFSFLSFYALLFNSIAGTLTVNVSVLLLSLASPDESSLVSVVLVHLIINFIRLFCE